MEKDLFDYIKMGWNKMTAKKNKQTASPAENGQRSNKIEVETANATPQEAMADISGEEQRFAKPWNFIAFQEKMLPMILTKVENLLPKAELYPERDLLLYINDPEKVEVVIENAFDNTLAAYIENRKGTSFRVISITQGEPEPIMLSARVNDEVTLAIRKRLQPATVQVQPEIVGPAVLEVLGSRCKIEKEGQILIPEEGKIWNIGWGEMAEINGIVRFNQIAWGYTHPENEDQKIFLISRAHAFIKFSNGRFKIAADIRGTRQSGKRTKVQRKVYPGEKPYELNVPGMTITLHDGDIIHLNGEKMKFHLPQAMNE